MLETPKWFDPGNLDPAGLAEYVKVMAGLESLAAGELLQSLYPDEDTPWHGPPMLRGLIAPGQTLYARHRYAKHLEFFNAGLKYRERFALCANRIGKTLGMGGYETACHLTGWYPTWWEGVRWREPISCWAAGRTNETTRDIVQHVLLGEVEGRGADKTINKRGLIPAGAIGDPVWKAGVQHLVDTIPIRHVSGGWSDLSFKSYDQSSSSYEGTGKHVIWLDEQPPADVYGECVIRTATLGGRMMCTFTPIEGLSGIVLEILTPDQGGQSGGNRTQRATRLDGEAA
jgi:phage terminase large subunit-like protein